jgi:voltage-gated potassium channel
MVERAGRPASRPAPVPAPRPVGQRAGPSIRRIRIWLAVALAAIAIGSAGYVVLLGWSIPDSLYMTMISITTVGFGEVRPLDGIGRVWTTLVILAGVGIIGATIGLVAETALELALRERDPGEAVKAIGDHFIVCGYGRVGATTAEELGAAGSTAVVVEIDQLALQRARTHGFIAIEGDATEEGILQLAGIERCRGLVATMDADVKNVYLTLSARAIKPGIYIVARASSAPAEAILRQAGADHVVSPYATAGRRIAELALDGRAGS